MRSLRHGQYFLDDARRYVIMITDSYFRFGFAWPLKAVLRGRPRVLEIGPRFALWLKSVLTDNGSEFMKHFDK